MKYLLLLITFLVTSSCVTSEQRKPHEMEVTSKVSMPELANCSSSQCYIDLSLKEVTKLTKQIDKDAANLFIATNLLALGRGEQAVAVANQIENKQLKYRFDRQFNNMYFGMTVEIEANPKEPSSYNLVPLKNLLGKTEEMSLPYATFLAINDQIEDANSLANSLTKESEISRFYRAITLVHSNQNRLEEAMVTAEKIVSRGSRSGRDLAIANFVGKLYLADQQKLALELLQSFKSAGAINIGHRNVAIAMAKLGEVDEAIKLNEKLEKEQIRARNLIEVSKALAELGEIDGIRKILQSSDGDSIQPSGFGQIIATLLEYNHSLEAKGLMEDERNDARLLRAFAEFGFATKDQLYFQRALDLYVKSDETNRDNPSKRISSVNIPIMYEKSAAYAIASAMARAGFLDQSIDFLHENVSETEMIGMRGAIFYELSKKMDLRPEISSMGNTLQLDFSKTKPEYISHALKQYLKLIQAEEVSLEFLNRIIKYSENIPNSTEKEAILVRIVPLYATVGEKLRAHELITGLDSPLSRINSIMALALLSTPPENIVYHR